MARVTGLRSGHIYLHGILQELISIRSWVDPRTIVRPEGLCQWKIPVTVSGIEPVTLWFVVQCLSQLYHHSIKIDIEYYPKQHLSAGIG